MNRTDRNIQLAIDRYHGLVEKYNNCRSPYNYQRMQEAKTKLDEKLTSALLNPETLKPRARKHKN